jgi:hypothetical protein
VTARKPPRQPEERLVRWAQSMTPGAVGGRVASASPLGVDLGRLAARMRSQPGAPGVGGISWQQDTFTVASPPVSTYTLTYQPFAFSEAIVLRGKRLLPGIDYTISGTTLTITSAQTLVSGDKLFAAYEYLAQTPIAPTATYSSVVLDDSPAGYWRLDEPAGPGPGVWADSSGNGHDLAVTGYSLFSSVAGLLVHDSDAAVSLPSGAGSVNGSISASWFTPSSMSVEGWFKTTTGGIMLLANHDTGLSGVDRQFQFRLNAGQVEFIVFNTTGTIVTVTSPLTYNDGNAHYVCGTYAGGGAVVLYVDGAAVASSTMTGSLSTCSAQFILGAFDTSGTNQFVGVLDEFALYPSALSLARVSAHYAAR